MITLNCDGCGREYKVYPSTVKWNAIRKRKKRFCSRDCQYKTFTGVGSPMWKGGNIAPSGYVRMSVKNTASGFIYEHRQVMERHLGRKLLKEEQVHHINHNKQDNRIENLMVVSIQEHRKLHPPKGGEQHPTSKLKRYQVEEIRQKYSTGKYRQIDLANEYGVCFQNIHSIVRNKIWK